MSLSRQDLQQLMQDTAIDAVKYAQEEFSIALDSSLDSIQRVDDLILQARTKYGAQIHDSKIIFTLCHMLGAYIGEVVRHQYGGTWIYDETHEDAPSVFLLFQEQTFAFAGIVYQRLINDQTMSVYLYAQEAIEQIKQAHS